MGYDARLCFGPRTSGAALRGVLPSGVEPVGQMAYDDFIAARGEGIVAVGHGERCTLILDPDRRIDAARLQRWVEDAPDGLVLSLDLCERIDDYVFEVHTARRKPFVRTWTQRTLAPLPSSTPRPRVITRLRFPRKGSVPGLLALAEQLGYDENFLDWEFTAWGTRAPRATRVRRGEAVTVTQGFAFGPPFLRALFVPERDAKWVLAKLARYAKLEHLEALDLDLVLRNCMSARQIAVGECGAYTALFDESGSLAFDLRWLGPDHPAPVLAVWGHVEGPNAPPERRADALQASVVFGFAVWSGTSLVRRVTWVDGKVSSSVGALPAPLVSSVGEPLAIERRLARAAVGARWRDVETLLANVGFAPALLRKAELSLYRVTPRT